MQTIWRSFIAVFVMTAFLPLPLSVEAGESTRPAAPAAPQAAAAPENTPPQNLNPGEAFNLMTGEAAKGVPSAMLTLGLMYERGVGTPRNFIKAFEWYRKAADAGLAEGYYNVGVCHEIGMGTSGNPKEAFVNFEKSAELELAQGLYKLASLYFLGFGVAKNENWGVELLKRAAAAGHLVAANDLGVIYFSGDFGQTKDAAQAFTMFSRSAQLGNAEAMKNLAVFYRDGLGGKTVDPAQEFKWYLLAGRAGYPAGALDQVVGELRTKLGPERVKAIEAEAESWITNFKAQQQPPAPPKP